MVRMVPLESPGMLVLQERGDIQVQLDLMETRVCLVTRGLLEPLESLEIKETVVPLE